MRFDPSLGESKSVCCLSVDVVDESFVGCGKLKSSVYRCLF